MELLRTENYCLGPLRKPTPHVFILYKASIINRKITTTKKSSLNARTQWDLRVTSYSIFLCSCSVQFCSVARSCLTLCNPMNRSTPGLPVHHQLPEFIQTHVHRVSDAIQPSHPRLSPSPPTPNPSQHPMSQLFTWGGQSTGVSASASFLP